MLKKMMKRLKKEEKGFTLIELLAVIVILAVIAVIAVPLIGKIIDNTKKDSDVAAARQIYDAARLYITGENAGVFKDVTFKELYETGYIAKDTVLPSTKVNITDTSIVNFDADGKLENVTLNSKVIDDTEILQGKAAAATPTAT